MAVLFAWNQRPFDHISYENLRLATELPDPELRRTLWVIIYFKLYLIFCFSVMGTLMACQNFTVDQCGMGPRFEQGMIIITVTVSKLS